MIEVTDEMGQAYEKAWSAVEAAEAVMMCAEHDMGDCPYHEVPGARRRAGLAAVLAIAERDYDVSPKLPQVEHRPKGDVWWNLSAETYMAECVCGEEFSGWPRSDAEERLLTHLEREARP